MLAILGAVQQYLTVILICIFLMTSDFEHISMCLPVIYTSSYIFFDEVTLKVFGLFLIWLFVF